MLLQNCSWRGAPAAHVATEDVQQVYSGLLVTFAKVMFATLVQAKLMAVNSHEYQC